MAKIGFLGLGVMGFPMAGHLAAAGHQVTVYNRTTAKAEDWVARHGLSKLHEWYGQRREQRPRYLA